MSLGAFCYSENKDGSCEISYEDYGEFSGMDYEAIYKLDPVNRSLLETVLREECTGTLPEMLEQKFGLYLNSSPFCSYLSSHDIHYEFFSWCS